MTTTGVVSRRTFQTLFITLVVVISLFAAAAYVDYSTAQSNQSLKNQISKYLSEIASLEANNTSLQNQINTLQDTVNTLNSQIASLQGTIAQLQNQIATLQQQLGQLRAAKMIGNFTWSNNCPALGNCNYNASGAYANVGTLTARAVSITFSFYAQPGFTGILLCQTTVITGDVVGRSIDLLPNHTCAGTSATPAQSMDYQFHFG